MQTGRAVLYQIVLARVSLVIFICIVFMVCDIHLVQLFFTELPPLFVLERNDTVEAFVCF